MVPIFKDGIWKLEALSDSDFANDKDTRYSVYGCHFQVKDPMSLEDCLGVQIVQSDDGKKV